MDTLFEYAAQGMFPFKDQKIRNSFIIELDRRCKTSWLPPTMTTSVCSTLAFSAFISICSLSFPGFIPNCSCKDPAAFTLVTKIFRRKPQFLFDEFRNPRLAITALASSHHGSGPVLDSRHCMDSQRIMKSRQDLSLGHVFTAAKDLSIVWIFSDRFHRSSKVISAKRGIGLRIGSKAAFFLMRVPSFSSVPRRMAATRRASGVAAVTPGDSIPTRLMVWGIPAFVSIRKSRASFVVGLQLRHRIPTKLRMK